MNTHRTIRAVAWYELFKGVAVLLAATGILTLTNQDAAALAVSIVEHARLNPASHYPQIFLDAASHLHDTNLSLLALGAGSYVTLRFVEAYGLFLERLWAEALAAGSGAIYVPFELAELVRQPSWHVLAFLVINLAVVAIMVDAMLQRRRTARR